MYWWKIIEELLKLFWLRSDKFSKREPKTQSYRSHRLYTPVTGFDYLVQLILLLWQEKISCVSWNKWISDPIIVLNFNTFLFYLRKL